MTKKEQPAQVEVNWWLLILGVIGFLLAVVVAYYYIRSII